VGDTVRNFPRPNTIKVCNILAEDSAKVVTKSDSPSRDLHANPSTDALTGNDPRHGADICCDENGDADKHENERLVLDLGVEFIHRGHRCNSICTGGDQSAKDVGEVSNQDGHQRERGAS
jgi:hypothetical protein